jgi:hypothetical protein
MNMCHKRNFVFDKYVQSAKLSLHQWNLVQPTQPLYLNNCVLTFDIIAYSSCNEWPTNPKQMLLFFVKKITHKMFC